MFRFIWHITYEYGSCIFIFHIAYCIFVFIRHITYYILRIQITYGSCIFIFHITYCIFIFILHIMCKRWKRNITRKKKAVRGVFSLRMTYCFWVVFLAFIARCLSCVACLHGACSDSYCAVCSLLVSIVHCAAPAGYLQLLAHRLLQQHRQLLAERLLPLPSSPAAGLQHGSHGCLCSLRS